MYPRRIIMLSTLLLLFLASWQAAHADGHTTTFFQLKNHIALGMPEQDVFIETADDSSQVVRIEAEDAKDPATLAMAVFGTKEVVEHDPFKLGESPLGPFDKGDSLGFTLGEWLAGGGSGSYTVDGDRATLDFSVTDLVPESLYTVWCARVTFPPDAGSEDRPCGEADGSNNSFTTDASGKGKYRVEMAPLKDSSAETASVVALAYHSDGKTYGDDPGAFGQSSHVQLAWIIPEPAPTSMPITGAVDDMWHLLMIGGLLLAVGFFMRRRHWMQPSMRR